MFEQAETGYPHCSSQDITMALYLVMTLALITFFCFFSSLSMGLLVFHLEYLCILLWLIRLTNCLKIGWSLCPKRRENAWFSGKLNKLYFLTPYWYFKWFNTDLTRIDFMVYWSQTWKVLRLPWFWLPRLIGFRLILLHIGLGIEKHLD